MRTAILTFSFSLLGLVLHAQTTLFNEDFETGGSAFSYNTADLSSASGTTGTNQWVVNDNYVGGTGTLTCLGFPFSFTIPSTTAQPAGISSPNGQYAHIVADAAAASGINCASFQAADGLCVFDESNFMSMNSDISTIGMNNIELTFWWLCAGSATSFGQVYYSLDGGISWTLASSSQFNGMSSWAFSQILNPSFDNQAQIRFGWRFVNETAVSAQDPPFSIDDIAVSSPCQQTSSNIMAVACNTYYSPAGNIYTTTGNFTDTLVNALGCDSLISIDLTVNTVDTTVTQVGPMLSANVSSANYQWLDCDNNYAPIPGETAQTFTASANGNYAVQVNLNDCLDTSSCQSVSTVSVQLLQQDSPIKLFPNPTDGLVFVDVGEALQEFTLEVYAVQGSLIQSTRYVNRANVLVELPEPSGLYTVVLQTKRGRFLTRVMKY